MHYFISDKYLFFYYVDYGFNAPFIYIKVSDYSYPINYSVYYGLLPLRLIR